MKVSKKILYPLVILMLILIASLIIGVISLNSKINSNKDIVLTIEKNKTINQVLSELNQKQILVPNFFYKIVIKIYVNLTDAKLYAGVHKFSHNLTNANLILQLLSSDNLQTTRVTFPEGITIYRFASILQKKMNIDSVTFINYCTNSDICKSLGVEQKSLEGYLKPVTYTFSVDANIMDILKLLVTEQIKEIDKYKNDIAKTKYSKHQILTLASIIEAETPVIAERKRISSVYHNRLKKNMLLQADPTLQYILKERKKQLLISDLYTDNLYNTYKYLGLPPGPINNPSPSSIEAAIFPENSDYYYFVAVGDGSNTHNFSTNYNQHLKYKNIYKKNIKK